MSITKKASELQAILKRNGLLKEAGSELIEHISSPYDQGSEGKTHQKAILEGCLGTYASDALNAAIGEVPSDYTDGMDLCGKQALAESGTTIDHIKSSGEPTGTPASVSKTAALKQKLQACMLSLIRKQAAFEEAMSNQFISATLVMLKVAALSKETDEATIDKLTSDIQLDFVKLAKANPLFGPACEHAAMRKMANLIEALAEALGISLELAAAALDAAMENDPEAQALFNNLVLGLALSDLAEAEAQALGLMAGLQNTADNVSLLLGQLITPDDLILAVLDVVDQAALLGVLPLVLIQLAADQILSGGLEGLAVLVTPLDLAIALQLILEAAAEGISPELLIQGLAGELLGGAPELVVELEPGAEFIEEPVALAQPELEPAAEEVQKVACLLKLASTRRGANLIKVLAGY